MFPEDHRMNTHCLIVLCSSINVSMTQQFDGIMEGGQSGQPC